MMMGPPRTETAHECLKQRQVANLVIELIAEGNLSTIKKIYGAGLPVLCSASNAYEAAIPHPEGEVVELDPDMSSNAHVAPLVFAVQLGLVENPHLALKPDPDPNPKPNPIPFQKTEHRAVPA